MKRDVTTLKAGDCTEAIPDGRMLDVPVIDCAKPRREELYAVLTLSGSKYPGKTGVDNQANDMCNDKLDSMLKRRRAPGRDRHLLLDPDQVLVSDRRPQPDVPDPAPEGLLQAPAPGLAHGERPGQGRGGAVTGVQVDGSRLHHEPAAVVVEPEAAAVRGTSRAGRYLPAGRGSRPSAAAFARAVVAAAGTGRGDNAHSALGGRVNSRQVLPDQRWRAKSTHQPVPTRHWLVVKLGHILVDHD